MATVLNKKQKTTPADGQPYEPVIGVVLHEEDTAIEADPETYAREGYTVPAMQSPDHWGHPMRSAIANGCDVDALMGVTPADAQRGVDGIVEAVKRLDGQVDLIIGTCGFMHRATKGAAAASKTTTLLSSVDLIDFALSTSSAPLGILTYSLGSLTDLLADHPQRDRLRLVGLSHMPHWDKCGLPDAFSNPQWTYEGLGVSLEIRLKEAFAPGGEFEDIAALILECGALPEFRPTVRRATSIPVFDFIAIGRSLLV